MSTSVVVSKKWYQSKTMWFNVASLVGIIIQYSLDNSLAPQWAEFEVLGILIVNGILRLFFTDRNLTK